MGWSSITIEAVFELLKPLSLGYFKVLLYAFRPLE
jgi:hypothetical protein